jgi:(p)ppGpp synthase/HD superfamily hydrolase
MYGFELDEELEDDEEAERELIENAAEYVSEPWAGQCEDADVERITLGSKAMKSIVDRAIEFATIAHEGQVRKYTGEPYVTHPIAVSKIVATVPHTEEMLVAAILHDTVEDTEVTLEDIEREFGKEVMALVFWLTDVSQPSDGNRAERKALDHAHLALAPAAAQTIKVCDLIHNTANIRQHDLDFWRVYRKEKLLLMDILVDADPTLRALAMRQIERE